MPRIAPDIDNKSLLGDLESAIESDKRYWIRNEAKIRASVTSNSYEEFRDLVDTAHLSCLHKNDIIKKQPTNWNPFAKQKNAE